MIGSKKTNNMNNRVLPPPIDDHLGAAPLGREEGSGKRKPLVAMAI